MTREVPRRIVITGVTSGIGKALAFYYAQPGVTLGLIGRRQTLLEAVTHDCRAHGATAVAAALDVQDATAMHTYARQFVAQTGGVDLVIANAAVGDSDNLASGDAAYHSRLFAINVIGLLNTLLPFVPPMITQHTGHLVAIASVAGFRALPGSTTYAATKMAVRALMEGYGWTLRRYGIATTTINPGFVISEMTARNQFRMPFLQPTDVAARKIARAIQRRRQCYTFPWPMALAAHVLPYIPGAILGRLQPPEKRPNRA